MDIVENIRELNKNIAEDVTLVAVSKTKPEEDILTAYDAGHRDFGENKVQELTRKYETLPKDIVWHFIGHLQTNKVKYIAPFVSLIHAVDSKKLLQTVNKEGAKNKRIIPCLIQLKIAQEDTKFGLSEQELLTLLEEVDIHQMTNIEIRGVMGMATNSDDKEIVTNEFLKLKTIFNNIKKLYFRDKEYFKEISMGMSHDYMLAINAGSTMVRIGSSIFGERIYNKTKQNG